VAPSVRTLPRVVPAAVDKPVRPEAAGNQELMATLAVDPSAWTTELADLTAQAFDAMAQSWNGERGGYRPAPLIDALDRGGPFPGGNCLELGCGTGLLTPYIESRWPRPISVDLSAAMLQRAESPLRVRVDASTLPFASDSFMAVVIGDGPLFASEVTRVLASGGVLVWSNALGRGAPYFVETSLLLDALGRVEPDGAWQATESEASWGSWVVLRRAA
jgi:SAM-dependent methyltransferase